MGWWKINTPSRGQIDPTHVTGSRLLNAVPGEDTCENHYNGDEPADSMGVALDEVLALMGIPIPRPGSDETVSGVSKQQILDLFLHLKVPERFTDNGEQLLAVVKETWREIDGQYEEEWNRPPYPEERMGICSFVFNPMFQ